MIVGFEILFFIILIGLSLSIVYWSWKNGISPMPSSGKARNAILGLIPSDFKGNISELGSGWGKLAFSLAEAYPHSIVHGYETSPVPFFWSEICLKIFPRKNLMFHRQDFFQASLEDTQLVVCYLYPKAMQKLRQKFEGELKKGSFVISNTFAIPEWTPFQTVTLKDIYRTSIYLYKI